MKELYNFVKKIFSEGVQMIAPFKILERVGHLILKIIEGLSEKISDISKRFG